MFIEKNLPNSLTEEQFHDLFADFKTGNEEAKKKIVTHNIRLVISRVMENFKTVNYDKKELVAIGNIGLVKAVNTFNIDKKKKFSTYASYCIDNEIRLFLRKLKNDKYTDSIDDIIKIEKDGNTKTLHDILSDDVNIEEDYVSYELTNIVQDMVLHLPIRDRDIVCMRFGFFGSKRYTIGEISEKMGFPRYYISRLLSITLKRLRKELDKVGVTEKDIFLKHNDIIIKAKNGRDGQMPKLKNIYQYFATYSKLDVNCMLDKLTDEEMELVTKRYGVDLDNPKPSLDWEKEDTLKFYGVLVPKMKRLLEKQEKNDKTIKKRKQKENTKGEKSKEVIVSVTEKEIKEDSEVIIEQENNMSKEENSIETLSILKKDILKESIMNFTPKEITIASLKLGFVNGKYFSTPTIASFLDVEEKEVLDITKRVLLWYKGEINNEIDNVIEAVTKPSVLEKTKKDK